MTHRFAAVWLVLAAAGAVLATGPLVAESGETAQVGTARIAFAPGTIEDAIYTDGVDLVASYVVIDDELQAASADRPVPAAHRDMWEQAVATIPLRWRRLIRQFSVVDEGRAGTVAMVHQSGLDPERWLLSIDRADAADPDLIADTLVHELAHLVTMGDDEFTFTHRLDGDCDGVMVPVGCAHRGSLLARWSDAFWTTPEREATFDPDAFVARYAASGPHEDLAETFLHWMRGDEITGDSVLAAKFSFLDGEPDLVALRANR